MWLAGSRAKCARANRTPGWVLPKRWSPPRGGPPLQAGGRSWQGRPAGDGCLEVWNQNYFFVSHSNKSNAKMKRSSNTGDSNSNRSRNNRRSRNNSSSNNIYCSICNSFSKAGQKKFSLMWFIDPVQNFGKKTLQPSILRSSMTNGQMCRTLLRVKERRFSHITTWYIFI